MGPESASLMAEQDAKETSAKGSVAEARHQSSQSFTREQFLKPEPKPFIMQEAEEEVIQPDGEFHTFQDHDFLVVGAVPDSAAAKSKNDAANAMEPRRANKLVNKKMTRRPMEQTLHERRMLLSGWSNHEG